MDVAAASGDSWALPPGGPDAPPAAAALAAPLAALTCSGLDDLPAGAMTLTTSFLTERDVVRLSTASRAMRAVTSSNDVWGTLFQRDFRADPVLAPASDDAAAAEAAVADAPATEPHAPPPPPRTLRRRGGSGSVSAGPPLAGAHTAAASAGSGVNNHPRNAAIPLAASVAVRATVRDQYIERRFQVYRGRARFGGAAPLSLRAIARDVTTYLLPPVARAAATALLLLLATRYADGRYFARHPALALPAMVCSVAVTVAVAAAALVAYAWFVATGRYAAVCGYSSARVPAAVRRVTAALRVPVNLPTAVAVLDAAFPVLPFHALRVAAAAHVGGAMHAVSTVTAGLAAVAVPATLLLGHTLLRHAWSPGGAAGARIFGDDALEVLFGVVALPLLLYAFLVAPLSHLAGAAPLALPRNVAAPRVMWCAVTCRLLVAAVALLPLVYHAVVRAHCLDADLVPVRAGSRGAPSRTRTTLCTSAWDAFDSVANDGAVVAANATNPARTTTWSATPLPAAANDGANGGGNGGGNGANDGSNGGDGVTDWALLRKEMADDDDISASAHAAAAAAATPSATPAPTTTDDDDGLLVKVVYFVLWLALVAIVAVSGNSSMPNLSDDSVKALARAAVAMLRVATAVVSAVAGGVVAAGAAAANVPAFVIDFLGSAVGAGLTGVVCAASVAHALRRQAPHAPASPTAALVARRVAAGVGWTYAAWAAAHGMFVLTARLLQTSRTVQLLVASSGLVAVAPLVALLAGSHLLDNAATLYTAADDADPRVRGELPVHLRGELDDGVRVRRRGDRGDRSAGSGMDAGRDPTTALLSNAAAQRTFRWMRAVAAVTLTVLAADYDFQDRVPLLARLSYTATAAPLLAMLLALTLYTVLGAVASLHASVRALPTLALAAAAPAARAGADDQPAARTGADADADGNRATLLDAAYRPLPVDDYPVWHAAQPMVASNALFHYN